MSEQIPDLELYRVAETAERLDVPAEQLRQYANELHGFVLPTGRRWFASHYVDSLAESDEWLEGQEGGRYKAVSTFAGGTIARQTIELSELQYEERVLSAFSNSKYEGINSAAAADLLRVAPTVLARWRSEGLIPAGTVKGRNTLMDEEQFSKTYSWQRPFSYPHKDLQPTGALLSNPQPKPERGKNIPRPDLVQLTKALEILDIKRDALLNVSDYMHRFETPSHGGDTYSAEYLRTLAATSQRRGTSYIGPFVAEHFARSKEALDVMEATEASYTQSIDQVFNQYGPIIPDYVASALLGVNKEALRHWRNDGRLDADSPLDRSTFDKLYRWRRPS